MEERKDKRNHQDFVLWKFKKEGEPFWASPWGEGRPGWHIECSGMSRSLLGETFDIHGGGLDLKFPHHECEIAQSEGANGQTFARYWMHNGYITVDEEKMSKSLGNFFTLAWCDFSLLEHTTAPLLNSTVTCWIKPEIH